MESTSLCISNLNMLKNDRNLGNKTQCDLWYYRMASSITSGYIEASLAVQIFTSTKGDVKSWTWEMFFKGLVAAGEVINGVDF